MALMVLSSVAKRRRKRRSIVGPRYFQERSIGPGYYQEEEESFQRGWGALLPASTSVHVLVVVVIVIVVVVVVIVVIVVVVVDVDGVDHSEDGVGHGEDKRQESKRGKLSVAAWK